MKKLVVGLCATLCAASTFADWTYENGYILQGEWKLGVSVSGSNLSIKHDSNHKSCPSTTSLLDLTEPITDAGGNEYHITALERGAFHGDVGNYGKIGEVRLPNTLTKIGVEAFKNSKVTNVVFEAGSAITRFEEGCFFQCSSLVKLTPDFPSTVTHIGYAAFYLCSSLTLDVLKLGDIGQPLGFGGTSAFSQVKATEIDIRSSGVAVPKYTFESMSKLRDIRIHDPMNPPTFGSPCFSGKDHKDLRLFVPKGLPSAVPVTPLAAGELAAYKTKFGGSEPEPIGLTTLSGLKVWVVEYSDPFVATKGMIVAGDPANIGGEGASPAYGIHVNQTRPITCSVPGTASYVGVAYQCTGYTLQKLVDGTVVDTRSGTGTSVTIPSEDEATYLLKWNWVPAGFDLSVVAPTIPFPTEPVGVVLQNGQPAASVTSYQAGTKVTLTAVPAAGARFDHWEGDVPAGFERATEIEITMDGARKLAAVFHANSWLYLSSENKITDGAWKIGVSRSGTELSIDAYSKSSWSYPGYKSILDLTMPVKDAQGTDYTIVKLLNASFSGGDEALFASSIADFRLPNTVRTINNYCCKVISTLTNLVLSTSLTSIGDEVFRNCSALKTVTPYLPPTLTSFGKDNFCQSPVTNRLQLGKVGQPLSFSGSAFHSNCFTEMEIFGNIASISGYAFGGSTSLRKVYVHGTRINIGSTVFESAGKGTQAWFIPSGEETWQTWFDAGNLTPWDEATMRADFTAKFPEIKKTPLGMAKLGMAAGQWVIKWNPKPGLVVLVQ